MRLSGQIHVRSLKKKTWDIREYLTRFRIKWKELLIECLGETYGNCMSAILIGDKSELDEEIKDLYQKSGIGTYIGHFRTAYVIYRDRIVPDLEKDRNTFFCRQDLLELRFFYCIHV